MANITFKDNSDIVLRRVASNANDAMEQVGEMLVEAVQNKILYGYHSFHGNPPHTEIVDTGALFDSIKAEVTKASQNTFSTSVGTDVSYAKYVHEGTSKLIGRPFLSDATMESQDKIYQIFSGTLPNGI
jgi:hypothetical protein